MYLNKNLNNKLKQFFLLLLIEKNEFDLTMKQIDRVWLFLYPINRLVKDDLVVVEILDQFLILDQVLD